MLGTKETFSFLSTQKRSEARKLLSADEIVAIKEVAKKSDGGKYNKYTAPEGLVTTTFISPDFTRLSDDEKGEIVLFLKCKKEDEAYRYENLIVNALLKQFEIGRKFGLSNESLCSGLNLNVEYTGRSIADDKQNLYLRTLDRHVVTLAKEGASEEELVIELAGHIFHESVHDADGNMSQVFFNGKGPFGEVSTVTAQLAYYLEIGYEGPTTYNSGRYLEGVNKIQSGENSSLDYDIATCVAGDLIFQSLLETYPSILITAVAVDHITACRIIVEKLTENEKQLLIPSLKKAIANSADELQFKAILEQVKQEKNRN